MMKIRQKLTKYLDFRDNLSNFEAKNTSKISAFYVEKQCLTLSKRLHTNFEKIIKLLF